MKVIIVGAGIGGLSAYHALRKYLFDTESGSLPVVIKIYESHGSPASTTSNIGGGLGLAPNGLRAIASISKNAADYIQERGFPGAIVSFRNSSGRLLGQYWNGRPERYGFGQLMLRRADVHMALLQDIPPDVIVWGTKVQLLREAADGVHLELADGSSDSADLVIGADGVRSIIRECIFENKYPAEYDGLTGVGGFIPFSSLSQRLQDGLRTEGVTMTFGKQGFFGYSMCGPGDNNNDDATDKTIQWWSIYESTLPPSREQAHSDIRSQLLARHGSWKSPYDTSDSHVYENIISLGCSSASLLILPRYVTPRIPQWCSPSGSGKIILLGDAAHAMPPDSGQGVSCAVEDAVAIGLLLKHYRVSKGLGWTETLKRTAKGYEDIRMKRVWKILDFAKRSGDSKKKQSWFEQGIRDFFIWILCKLPESINDGLYGYDIAKSHVITS